MVRINHKHNLIVLLSMPHLRYSDTAIALPNFIFMSIVIAYSLLFFVFFVYCRLKLQLHSMLFMAGKLFTLPKQSCNKDSQLGDCLPRVALLITLIGGVAIAATPTQVDKLCYGKTTRRIRIREQKREQEKKHLAIKNYNPIPLFNDETDDSANGRGEGGGMQGKGA